MKLTDYVAEFLARQGIKYIFGLTGGAVVHFFDSLAKNPDITPVFTHHEQAAALAAQAYGRIKNDLGACIVTTGPGGTNALTGVLAAWMDSIPCIYISGQSRIQHSSHGKKIRQLGSQEFDIVSLVSRITKYSVMLDKPENIKYVLQKAVYLAKEGRPGPVWIDIPLNFQWEDIEPDSLPGFQPDSIGETETFSEMTDKDIQICMRLLSAAKKPIVLGGYGIRLAHAEEEFKKFLRISNLPCVFSWNASDLLPGNHYRNIGRIGLAGQPGASQAFQNCDFILAVGSHLCLNITGLDNQYISKRAKKVMVDIDPVEIDFRKNEVDLAINCDAKVFLQKMLQAFKKNKIKNINPWIKQCREYKSCNAIAADWKKQKKYLNPYVFLDALSNALDNKDTIVVDGGGTALYMPFQAIITKQGQRLIVSSGIAAMGTGLPDSIGACLAGGGGRTVCIIGDGSMQLNIQELQTIIHHNLPIKIFIFNNSGYLAIRHTQNSFLEGRYIGSSPSGGLSLPNFQKVGHAYGIRTVRINNHRELQRKIKQTLGGSDPVVCEIMISPDQQMWLGR